MIVENPLYISSVTLENIRCFEYCKIDFQRGRIGWTVIAGDNNAGKTTILRCLAIGLCDDDSAAALFREPGNGGEFIRRGKSKGVITIELAGARVPLKITTIIEKSDAGFETVRQRSMPLAKDFPWHKIFVCGYGAKWGEGSVTYDRYMPVDAVYTLFCYDSPLLDTELMVRRGAKFSPQKAREICRYFDHVLMLEPGSVRLVDNDLIIDGDWGEGMPLSSLGDGYQHTLAWLMDLLGWADLAGLSSKKNRLPGIVLIDEIEKHLHPRWQREIILRLNVLFPNIQFIVSTQSEKCVGGLADIPSSDRASLAKLTRKVHGPVVCEQSHLRKGVSYEDLLSSDIFDNTPIRPLATQNVLDRIRELVLKDERTPGEQRELRRLVFQLKRETPSLAEKQRNRQLLEELVEEMRHLTSRLKNKGQKA